MSRIVLAFFILTILGSAPSGAHADSYQVKTDYIYQFTKYMSWPKSSRQPASDRFVITVVGSPKFAEALTELSKVKTVGGRRIEVVSVAQASQIKKSEIVVVGSSREANLREVLKAVRGTGTLVVTHGEGLADKGAGINFFVENGRLRFEINRTVLNGQEIKVGSRLLRLARLVDR